MDPDPTAPPGGVPEELLDPLYGGSLGGFTAARNDLAKSLRADAQRDAADWVKGLRKPSRAAWIANQLSRRRAADVKRLLEGGEELRALQERLLEGTADSAKLRKAASAEQRTIDRLMKAAREIGAEHGAGATVLDRVAETLQAASADPALGAALRLGRLTRERRASSLGLPGAGSGAAPPKRKRGSSDAKAAERRARSVAARERRAAAKEVAAAERRLERARIAVDRARDELAEREAGLGEAQDGLEDARRALRSIR